jgi:hypothetical protein
MKRRTALASLTLIAAALVGIAATPARAIGNTADITVIDRNTGQVLPTYYHAGKTWVAGTPGTRYAVRVQNRAGGRVMAVMAIDGVNVVSGETADFSQNGYVFDNWQTYDISGWRKSQHQVAAFTFTALSNSYAARTGRPDNVGVIGVALFREAQPVAVVTPPVRPHHWPQSEKRREQNDGRVDSMAKPSPAPGEPVAESAAPAGAAAPSPSTRSVPSSRDESFAARQVEKLGTGHGQREHSHVNYTTFTRATTSPAEVVTIHYDSRENLMAMGVIPPPRHPYPHHPRPFPAEPQLGFVPDPR